MTTSESRGPQQSPGGALQLGGPGILNRQSGGPGPLTENHGGHN